MKKVRARIFGVVAIVAFTAAISPPDPPFMPCCFDPNTGVAGQMPCCFNPAQSHAFMKCCFNPSRTNA